jgi:hypothetical protein
VAVGGDKVVHTVAGSVAVVPGVCTRALKEKGWWAGPIWWVAGTVAIGRAQQQAFPIFQIIFKPSNFENSKPNLPFGNNFPFGKKFKVPTEFELKFRKQKQVEFGLNLK